MELKAFGKINLSIDVLGRREDGYHDVRMIMQSIDLHDNLNFKILEKGIKISSSDPLVPLNEGNIVYKVLKWLKSKYHIPCGLEVHIDKKIPIAAGLAGGSADAAAAIIAANSLWNLKLTYEDMIAAAKHAGADVAFCLRGGTALAEGIGEILTPLPELSGVFIVLAKPPVSVSTRDVYEGLNLHEISRRPDIEGLIRALHERNIEYIGDNMVNVLETVTLKKFPVIREIKKIMMDCGALGSLMSGSGPTVFGIFENRSDGEKCCGKLKEYTEEIYLTKPVSSRDTK